MESPDRLNDVVVEVRGLEMRRGARTILDGADLEVRRGEIVALMGPSGSGKTTLLRAMAALDEFDRGEVTIDRVTLRNGKAPDAVLRQLRRKVGMVFQFHCLFEHLPVLKNVCLAPVLAYGVKPPEAEATAMDLLRTLGVDHRARALPRELSGGEAQRVAIARALAVDPPVLLMDEPTASLDPSRRAELAAVLQQLVSRRRTLIVATHDEPFARTTATRVVRVANGRTEDDQMRIPGTQEDLAV
jgi:ABC-type polar amino acid transport system ATPase subunit